ncbi:MAG: DUF1192 domain-containing protein [Novosphingobium sp.]|nr:DUF1192 domain-containing protein [Novosphingobium sp.]
MDDDDRPVRRQDRLGAAGLLSGESLEGYSLDELDARLELLKAEIERIRLHREKAVAHRQAAEALFRSRPS